MVFTRIVALTGSLPSGAGSSSGATAAPVTTHKRPTASEDPADTSFLAARVSRDHEHEVFLLARYRGEPIGLGCHIVTAHDPHDFANALSAKLASRSRHVCVLLGAGVGKACGLPDVASLQGDIVRDLSPEEKPLLEAQLASGNIEQALSRLRRIANLLGDGETIGGLTAQSARDLDAASVRRSSPVSTSKKRISGQLFTSRAGPDELSITSHSRCSQSTTTS